MTTSIQAVILVLALTDLWLSSIVMVHSENISLHRVTLLNASLLRILPTGRLILHSVCESLVSTLSSDVARCNLMNFERIMSMKGTSW